MLEILLSMSLITSLVWLQVYRQRWLSEKHYRLKADRQLEKYEQAFERANAAFHEQEQTIKTLLACIAVERVFEGDRNH